MSQFVINNIISLTMYDKDCKQIMYTENVDDIEVESDSMAFVDKSKNGEHICMEAYMPNDKGSIKIEGFYKEI